VEIYEKYRQLSNVEFSSLNQKILFLLMSKWKLANSSNPSRLLDQTGKFFGINRELGALDGISCSVDIPNL